VLQRPSERTQRREILGDRRPFRAVGLEAPAVAGDDVAADPGLLVQHLHDGVVRVKRIGNASLMYRLSEVVGAGGGEDRDRRRDGDERDEGRVGERRLTADGADAIR
jgi:hypothetical protein